MTVQMIRSYKVTAYRQTAVIETRSFESKFFEQPPNGVEISQLQMQCSIEKTLKSEPNTCELVIHNLAERARNEFERLPLRVKVEAGYQGDNHVLFIGDVRPGFARSKLTATGWETRVNLGDGLRAYAEARVNRAYKKGTRVQTVLRDIVRALNLDLPADLDDDPRLQQALGTGQAIIGWAADELTRLLAPYGYTWSMQNGNLQVDRDSPGTREREIGEHTGMVDSPEFGVPEKNGGPPTVTVRHLLYPEVTPGERIRLYSGVLSAPKTYKVIRVSHSLDYEGADWTTEIEAKPL